MYCAHSPGFPLVAALLACALAAAAGALAAEPPALRPADRSLAAYFRAETAALASRCLAEIRTLEDWQARREEYRRQLAAMLGLWPPPARTDLQARVAGTVELPDVTIDRVVFQASPGLYATANLYLPRQRQGRLPAVLYVCGHSPFRVNGVSYGTKASYAHHGAYFARHGYACLVLDTLEYGEIEGDHHGTYYRDAWWWNSRGYTPAGAEAWLSIRALDYLQSRPEVDGERLAITGRSGGGAYSWWVAALDDRIKAAAPVAGITDLQNHVVDGVVEGHCDCMYVVNTFRWDYAQVAALVAPRPLLIANTDKDPIFPLEGVVRVHAQVRRIYELHGPEIAAQRLGLLITEGPHRDTQDLQLPVLRWFNRHLKGEDPLIEAAARPATEPAALRVFTELPGDQINTRLAEHLVPVAPRPALPADAAEWERRRTGLLAALRTRVFGGWPREGEVAAPRPVLAVEAEFHGLTLRAYDFVSQGEGEAAVPLRLYTLGRTARERFDLTVLNVLDEAGWRELLGTLTAQFETSLGPELAVTPGVRASAEAFESLRTLLLERPWRFAYVAPRGLGSGSWSGDARKQVQIRRRFMALGQTLAGMRVWDTRRAVAALRALPAGQGASAGSLWLQGEREGAVCALYAALFEPGVTRLDLWQLPHTHGTGPDLLNVLKYLDVPEAVALAAERSRVVLYDPDAAAWSYPAEVARRLGWPADRVQVRPPPAGG